jgi:hypothetical protein
MPPFDRRPLAAAHCAAARPAARAVPPAAVVDSPAGHAPAPPSPARRRALAAIGSAGLMAAGCGGTDLAGVGSGGTGQIAGSFSTGAISGFGSVIVNGIRYDDSAAVVTDDLGGARSLGQLGLGMVVEVEGSSDDTTGLGVARAIRVVSEVAGPVESVDAANGRFVVLGLPVQAGAPTVWEDARGIGSVRVGGIVEAWGFLDRGTGVLRASRVELGPAGTNAAKLRGPVRAFDPVALTFSIGPQAIDARRVALPAGLAQGVTVQVSGPRPTPGAAWQPERVVLVPSTLAGTFAFARVEGTIAGFASPARFELAGLQVDASGATYEGGTAAALRDGLQVRIRGRVSGGTIVAARVEVRDQGGDATDDETQVEGTIVRFGRIADFTVRDAAGRLFLVDATRVTRYENLTADDLRVGLAIRVRARRATVLVATEIRLDR